MSDPEAEQKLDSRVKAGGGLRYLYADPTASTVNYGDIVIDYAVRHLLGEVLALPKPAGVVDLRSGVLPGGRFDFALLPGVTVLREGGIERETIRSLGRPAYCLAGSYWRSLPRQGFLLRSRVVGIPAPKPVDMGTVDLLARPVGVRDPFTADLLASAGVEVEYVGCPTLHLPTDGVGDDGYVLFSLGRGRYRTQTAAAMRLARSAPVVGICHEKSDKERMTAAGWPLPLVDYRGDVELYLSYFKRASVVVTGRLHGALPALAYGKPVFYFGTRDSRTTILDDLGVRVFGYRDLPKALDRATAAFNRARVEYYREALKRLGREISRKFGISG